MFNREVFCKTHANPRELSRAMARLFEKACLKMSAYQGDLVYDYDLARSCMEKDEVFELWIFVRNTGTSAYVRSNKSSAETMTVSDMLKLQSGITVAAVYCLRREYDRLYAEQIMWVHGEDSSEKP